MGGGAFQQATADGEPTLNVSRLSVSEYAHLRDIYSTKLQHHFTNSQVHCPAATPDKEDHGDLDFIVASDGGVNFVELAKALGATGVICRSSLKATLGVPKTGSASTKALVVYKHCHTNNNAGPPTNVTGEEYAQIDIELVSPQLFVWFSFYASYGGMAGLLGHIVHNLGFTISDTGLWLRLKELEDSKKMRLANIADSDGRLQLTHDPSKAMQFMGLDLERYNAGFATLDELYSWLGECRLLSIGAIKIERDRAHEQNREAKRPVFSRFFDEWLPAHAQGTSSSPERTTTGVSKGEGAAQVTSLDLDVMREQYTTEAVEFFDKAVKFEQMRSTLIRTIDNATAANLLKPIIAAHSNRQDKQLNEIVRAFRRYVGVNHHGELAVLTTPHADAESELYALLADDRSSLRDGGAVSAWVAAHWEEARSLERQRKK